MKKLTKLVSVLLLVVLLSGLGGSAWAQDTSVYKIRFYSGNQGTLSGSTEGTYSYNATVTLPTVTATDGYYFKGFREAGMDNSTYVATDFRAKRDMDYVAAYGMLTSAVAYTVHFRSNTGATLYPSQTYYGNVGDRPVVAYRYIEGYQPQAYSLIKTLSADPAENVFTFTYSPATGITTTVIVPGAGGGGVVTPGAGGGVVTPGAGTTVPGAGTTVPGAGTTTPGAGTTPVTPVTPAAPEEIIDLDVPLAAPNATETPSVTAAPSPTTSTAPSAKRVPLPTWVILLFLVGLAGLITIPIVYFMFLRKGKDEDDEDDEDDIGGSSDSGES